MSEKNYKMLHNDRREYSRISGKLDLPYLVEIQTESYKWFLEKGIDETLREVFPISNSSGTLQIRYVSSKLLPPKYTF